MEASTGRAMVVRWAAVIAACAAVAASPTGAGAQTTEPAGTAVVAPDPSWTPPTLASLEVANGGAGLSWDVNEAGGQAWQAQYRAFAAGSAQALSSSSPYALPDHVVSGMVAIPQPDPAGSPGQLTGVTIQPLAGGAGSTVPLGMRETYLGFNGSGIVVAVQLQTGDYGIDLVLRRPGMADVLLTHLAAGQLLGAALVDPEGILFGYSPTDWTPAPLQKVEYLDFATDTLTLENGAADSYAYPAELTPTEIAWRSADPLGGADVVWKPRAGGTETRLTVGSGAASPEGIARSGSTVAFTAYQNGRYRLYFQPIDGSAPPTLVATTLGVNWIAALPGGGFAVLDDPSPAALGIYTVSTSGAFTLFQSIPPLWAGVDRVALSGGRLSFVDASTPSGALGEALWSLQTTKVAGAVTLGARTEQAQDAFGSGTVPPSVVTSGDRTAYLANTATGQQVVVLDGGATERTFTAPTDLAIMGLSGNHLLLHTNNTGSWSVMDVTTGASTPITTTIAAVWGPYAYYQGTKGQILRLDVTKPASATNPSQVRAGDKCGMTVLQVWGRWVAYSCTNGTTIHHDEVLDTATGTILPFPHGDLQALGDGILAWEDGPSGALNVMPLAGATHPVTAIGDVVQVTGNWRFWALDAGGAQDLAWVGTDLRIHVAPLAIAASAPAMLDFQADASLPSGGLWHGSFDASKPVKWKLTFKNAAGVVVRALSGTAADGSIRTTWNGKSSTGVKQPAGTYSWKLKLTGVDAIGTVSQAGKVSLL